MLNSEIVTKPIGLRMSSHFDTSSQYSRNHIQMVLGGLYRNKSDGNEYQLIEYLDDLNQAVFKNLKTLNNQVLSIHDFDNVTDGANAYRAAPACPAQKVHPPPCSKFLPRP